MLKQKQHADGGVYWHILEDQNEDESKDSKYISAPLGEEPEVGGAGDPVPAEQELFVLSFDDDFGEGFLLDFLLFLDES